MCVYVCARGGGVGGGREYLSESLSVIICSRMRRYVCASLILWLAVCFQIHFASYGLC